MIGYTIVGTKDIERAKLFYAPLFEAMGYGYCYQDEAFASWGDPADKSVPRFFVCTPIDGKPASVGNGSMTAFRVTRASEVAALYDLAMTGGGTDEGGPGFRPESYGDRFYVAYVRDPDGNKLAFYCDDGKANP